MMANTVAVMSLSQPHCLTDFLVGSEGRLMGLLKRVVHPNISMVCCLILNVGGVLLR